MIYYFIAFDWIHHTPTFGEHFQHGMALTDKHPLHWLHRWRTENGDSYSCWIRWWTEVPEEIYAQFCDSGEVFKLDKPLFIDQRDHPWSAKCTAPCCEDGP